MSIVTNTIKGKTTYVIRSLHGAVMTFTSKTAALSWVNGCKPMHETPTYNRTNG